MASSQAARQIASCHHRNSKSSGQVIPARSMPTTTALRRAYFHDIKSPVQVDIMRDRAVAAKNIFIGRGLGAGEVGVGAGDFEASGLSASAFARPPLRARRGPPFREEGIGFPSYATAKDERESRAERKNSHGSSRAVRTSEGFP
jgi:hypothetical protein